MKLVLTLTLVPAIDEFDIVLDILRRALVAIQGNGTFETLLPHMTRRINRTIWIAESLLTSVEIVSTVTPVISQILRIQLPLVIVVIQHGRQIGPVFVVIWHFLNGVHVNNADVNNVDEMEEPSNFNYCIR